MAKYQLQSRSCHSEGAARWMNLALSGFLGDCFCIFAVVNALTKPSMLLIIAVGLNYSVPHFIEHSPWNRGGYWLVGGAKA